MEQKIHASKDSKDIERRPNILGLIFVVELPDVYIDNRKRIHYRAVEFGCVTGPFDLIGWLFSIHYNENRRNDER